MMIILIIGEIEAWVTAFGEARIGVKRPEQNFVESRLAWNRTLDVGYLYGVE